MIFRRISASAAVILLFLTNVALAQDVTLSSADKKFELSGRILEFDGEFYRLDTIFGEMTIDGSGLLCAGDNCPDTQNYTVEVKISGATEMGAVLLPALLNGYGARRGYLVERLATSENRFEYHFFRKNADKPAAIFKFHTTNTDEGFADLIASEADIVMAMREIRPSEQKRVRDAGLGNLTHKNRSRVLALDAIVPIVSPSIQVKEISLENLTKVLSGEISDWAHLGGKNGRIEVHLPSARTGLGQAIAQQIMDPESKEIPSSFTRHEQAAEVKTAVENSPYALGITSASAAGVIGQVLDLNDNCGFSLDASRISIKNEDYPLSMPLFLYFSPRRLPKIAREFLSYTRSPSAQILIRRTGFVDQAPEEIGINQQGQRFSNAITAAGPEISLNNLKRMNETLSAFSRLSFSFRFEPGSVRLDAQSRSYVQQLARELESGTYNERELVFIGFSDGQGGASENQKISLKRAETIKDAVIKTAKSANFERVSIGVDAFGEALPMACDDTIWGRKTNRRVEVWIR